MKMRAGGFAFFKGKEPEGHLVPSVDPQQDALLILIFQGSKTQSATCCRPVLNRAYLTFH